jgi:MYXO-CTERM domain-containing protein
MLFLLAWSWASSASAQECREDERGCFESTAAWEFRDDAFDAVMLDTGWVPPSGPIQLRFGLVIAGSTAVDQSGTMRYGWPDAMTHVITGIPGTGRLAIDYGVEITARLKFDIEVAGIRYRWEGDIPVPGIPEDLRMANETMFDPFAFAAPLPSVSDTTDEVEVFRYDALGGIIPVPGVGGGINVVLVGELEAEYATVRLVVADAPPILGEGGMTLITPPAYGPALDSISHPEGTLHYRGQIVIRPSLYLSFAGTRETFPIVEIPVPILDRDADAIFGDETTHVPLPDITTDASIDFGLVSAGVRHERYVTITNEGEMELVVSELVAGGDFASVRTSATVPPRSTARAAIGFYSLTPGPHASVLRLETNDPDEPAIEIALSAMIEGTEFPPSDAGMRPDAGPPLAGTGAIDDGGCGCRTGEPSALALVLLLLIPAFRRRL